jgi:hypothetical protein
MTAVLAIASVWLLFAMVGGVAHIAHTRRKTHRTMGN